MGEGGTIAVLPLGATEQHGPHLPFDTDAIIAGAVAERTLQHLHAEIDIQLLPVETVGYSPEHADYAGTKSLAHDAAVARWIGFGADLKSSGIRKFVMLNAHGGNSPLMTIVATELRIKHAMLAVATSWTRFGYPDGLVSDSERAFGIHGGFAETSVMLALRPDLVDMDKTKNFPSRQQDWTEEFEYLRAYGPHAFGWKINDLNGEGAVGDATSATAEAGERMLDHATRGFAALIADIHRFDLSQFE